MAIALVQSAKGLAATSAVVALLPANATPGNIIVLAFASDDYNNVAATQYDWHQEAEMEQQTFHGGYLWWGPAAAQQAYGYDIGSATNSAWVIAEFSGLDASPYDKSEGQYQQSSVGSYTTPSIVPSAGQRLLIAMIGQSMANGGIPAPGSWTNSFTLIQGQAMGSGTGTFDGCGMAYRVVTGDGSTAFSTGASWSPVCQSQSGLILALKESAAVQEILPDADTVTTGWTATPLFSKLNDGSDATVVTATLA